MTEAQQDYISKFVGQRIKERRKVLKLSQGELAQAMGLSHQQIQKYESGANQISITRMLQFAKILNISPSYLHEGIELHDRIGASVETDLIQKGRSHALEVTLIEDVQSDMLLFKKALQKIEGDVVLHHIDDAEMVMDFLQNHSTKYGKRRPDIVILDLSMPKVSGMQLLKFIKRNPRLMDLPVIILTNSISKKELQEAYKLGAAGFIQKSIELRDFRESIESTIHYWTKVVALPQA
jgi:CheY-like chemotaxis protein/DNA-binding Xre family transcriptional regulator